MNPIDTKVRKLNMYYPDKLPSILGCDGAGVVEAVGRSVTRVHPGDEVFFSTMAWTVHLEHTLNTRW